MQPLLEVEGLTKTYPGFQLNEVSFSIYEDCITGFIGANDDYSRYSSSDLA